MSQLQSIEVSGPDIESAIAKGVADLGVSRDQVMVEVLEEPGRRLLGLGTRQAKVKLTVIRAPSTPVTDVSADPKPEARPESKPEPHIELKPASHVESRAESRTESAEAREARAQTRPVERPAQAGKPAEKPRKPERPERRQHAKAARTPDISGDELDLDDDAPAARPPASEAQLAEEAKMGAEVLRQLLHNMGFTATVEAQRAETDGDEPQHWTLEIRGRDLGVLIGKRGETLAALQYLTRLITSRELGHRANLVVDVEGYKARREAMLRRLAKRMAEQAVQRGRTVSMEPMPPHERRIVHLTLRDDPDVTTESVGEGDKRKVTVIPRRQQQQ